MEVVIPGWEVGDTQETTLSGLMEHLGTTATGLLPSQITVGELKTVFTCQTI